MSRFLNQIFTDAPLTVYGLIIFFAVFVGLFCWVYLRKGAFKQYEAMSLMPLREEELSREQ